MSDTIIRVEQLGKAYRIAHTRDSAPYRTLREDVMRLPGGLLSMLRARDGTMETFWALRDVSFEVKRGEVLGIIGRNGAGKSTLLKILSRITEPTKGKVDLYGRAGSLLEVGTGFHPELTGRENIFLNGAILGMSRLEVRNKFEEIVAFAEIEKFLDTPVKHYSSGMYVRLAFAVAAHLEPEILLVDEVLAVGDAEFQRKCLGKMENVAREGRTILFVSHNITAIVKLCGSAIWLENGNIRAIDTAEKAVQFYLASGASGAAGRVVFEETDPTKEASICAVELKNSHDEVASEFEVLSPIKVNVRFRCRRRFLDFRIDALVSRYDGIPIFSTTSRDYESIRGNLGPGTYQAELLIPGQFLSQGEYYLGVNLCEVNVKNYDLRESVLKFKIVGNAFREERSLGFLAYPFSWKLTALREDL
jgi:lipopolysaccharide transport system ATP-binding protein